MNAFRMLTIMSICLLVFSGCSKRAELGSPSSADITRIMVIDSSPTAPAFDVYLDKLKIAESLQYQQNKGYISLIGGDYDLSILTADTTENPLAKQNIGLKSQSSYTVLVAGPSNEMKLFVYDDDNDLPSKGKAKVRFISAVYDVPAVDLKVETTDKIISGNISYGKADKYKEINSGVYEFTVNLEGLGTPVARVYNAELKSRGVYTIVAMGDVSAGSAAMVVFTNR